MQGRIKMFNGDKGFGFIVGEDGNDYFAHISNVNSMQALHAGLFVSFEPNENDKGKYATKIMVIESKKPTFIAFGDVRIKSTNIKNYGISIKTRYGVQVFKFIPSMSDNWIKRNFSLKAYDSYWRRTGNYQEISKEEYLKCERDNFSKGRVYIERDNGERVKSDYNFNLTNEDFAIQEIPYLYITTYQNDNYTFYQDEVEFNIREKFKEIDDCML